MKLYLSEILLLPQDMDAVSAIVRSAEEETDGFFDHAKFEVHLTDPRIREWTLEDIERRAIDKVKKLRLE